MSTEIKKEVKVNRLSDFDLFLNVSDCTGKAVGWPVYDWRAEFYTWASSNRYVASSVGGVCTNCFNDGGRIHVVFDKHYLPEGELKVRFFAEIPNGIYPDGHKRVAVPASLGITLTREAVPCPHGIEVELVLPYIKGDKGDAFTYEDFTPEDKADLIAPIKEDFDRALDGKQDKLTFSDDFTLDDGPLRLSYDARNAWVIEQFNAYCVCHIPSIPEPVRAGGYNPQTRLFECNGITDIGLEEAKAMLAYAPLTRFITPGHGRNNWELFGVSESSLRTVFPIYQKNSGEGTGSFDKMFLRWGALETVRFVACNPLSCQEMFAHCPKLRTVYNLYVGGVKNTVEMFGGCTALEYVELNALSAGISFKSSRKLNLASLEYITARRAGSNLITITVHPDTFAKLADENNAEWHAVMLTAAENKITFISADPDA